MYILCYQHSAQCCRGGEAESRSDSDSSDSGRRCLLQPVVLLKAQINTLGLVGCCRDYNIIMFQNK